MVERQDPEERLDRIFHALADRTRRAILTRLATSPGVTVGELAEPFEMSLNAVSKHIKVLEAAGLLVRQRDGRMSRCSAELSPLVTAVKRVVELENSWNNRLDDLEAFLEDQS